MTVHRHTSHDPGPVTVDANTPPPRDIGAVMLLPVREGEGWYAVRVTLSDHVLHPAAFEVFDDEPSDPGDLSIKRATRSATVRSTVFLPIVDRLGDVHYVEAVGRSPGTPEEPLYAYGMGHPSEAIEVLFPETAPPSRTSASRSARLAVLVRQLAKILDVTDWDGEAVVHGSVDGLMESFPPDVDVDLLTEVLGDDIGRHTPRTRRT